VADDIPSPAQDDHSSHLLRMDRCVTDVKKVLKKYGWNVKIGCASCKTTESLRGEILERVWRVRNAKFVESILTVRNLTLVGSRRCPRGSYEVDGENRLEFIKAGLVARLECELQSVVEPLPQADQSHAS